MIILYRFLGVVALCLVLPACGGGGSDSDILIPPIGPFVVTVLEDDFSAGNLSNWTVQTGNVAVIPGGNPGPSMSMVGIVATASVGTAANFGVATPLKVSFRIDAGNSPILANNGTFSVINNAAPAPINTFVSFTDTRPSFRRRRPGPRRHPPATAAASCPSTSSVFRRSTTSPRRTSAAATADRISNRSARRPPNSS